jgi:predicted esterase
MRSAALCLAWLTLAACRDGAPAPSEHAPPAGPLSVASSASLAPSASVASSAAPVSAISAGALPALVGVAWLEHLDLPGGHEAFVTPPIGAREPRPLIVAVHGAGDRAEWACGGWRMVASEYAFVVCPQGLKMDPTRFGWDSAQTIRQRVSASIAAARARFGEYIAAGPTLYVGFSQGATLSGPSLLDPTQPFPLVALAEGGYSVIQSEDTLRRLKQRGLQRVLLACGTPACFSSMKAALPRFERIGIDVSIGGDPTAGHNLNGEMQAGLQRVWPWFVAGLPNWRGFPKR